ncbi:MAG: class I SAM-dependent methyltransferase [Patescibacteria group bacterium]
MNKNFYKRTNCRICGQSDLIKILDLGEMPSANSFLREDELLLEEQKFSLRVYFCETCKLLKLLDVVSPEILFGNYDYLTSASKPLAEHFVRMANELVEKFIKSNDDLMIEIGGNDAVLLESIKDVCRVLNIEPAKNIFEISRQKKVETINEFFSKKLAEKILEEYGSAKVIIANNVMAHIDDIKDVFEGIKILINDDGVFVFEVHWVGNLIGEGGFDQIYHEHLSYYSLHSLLNLVEQFDLKIFDIELVPIHGESLRVFVGKNFNVSDSVENFLNTEKELELNNSKTFIQFSKKVEKNKKDLKDLLVSLKKQGKKIVGYGAPAKGNTLLNYCGIDNTILDFITDTTSLKQGLYTPGTRIPIEHPDKIKESEIDYILLLAWNYADAILEKEKELREKGIKFIIPVPEPRVV